MPEPILTYTIEDYTNLKKAIAQGASRVKYGDKEVEYKSLEEMERILALMAKELGITKNRNRRKVAYFCKSK